MLPILYKGEFMLKPFGIKRYIFPQPALLIATYNDDHSINVMTLAWGNIVEEKEVTLTIDENHKTFNNILKNRAFTVTIGTLNLIKELDYFGIVSGNDNPNKFNNTKLTYSNSDLVNAPIINESRIVLECELKQVESENYGKKVIGTIKNVLIDEIVLNESNKVDVNKLEALAYSPFDSSYYLVNTFVGKAWNIGKEFINK